MVGVLVECSLGETTSFDTDSAILDWLPPLNTFESIGNISWLNGAYQFGQYTQKLQTLYATLEPNTANYHTFQLVENDVLVKITLYRTVNPYQAKFYPGIVLMGPDRLNIDKSTETPSSYFPSIVKIPVGYDTYVRFQNSKDDFLPIYQGIIPFTWYQMLTFNVSTLEPGLYVVAVFNSILEGSTSGSYGLALGHSIKLTFNDFMLGPYHAIFTYMWQGWGAGEVLIPYWIILGIGCLIILHQTCYLGNSPRTWYSFVTFWGGLIIIGSGCVVAEMLAYAFLQQGSPISDSLMPSMIWTVLFLLLPLVVGILICFFGLMIRVNLLIRAIVAFLAVGSCLVWASFYVGPLIALIGSMLPSHVKLPLHRLPFCGDYFRRFDEDLSGRRRQGVDDTDWEEHFLQDDNNEDEKNKDKKGKKGKKGKDAHSPTSGAVSAPAAASSGAAAVASTSQPFSDAFSEVGIRFVAEDEDATESDPDDKVARIASLDALEKQTQHVDREDASGSKEFDD